MLLKEMNVLLKTAFLSIILIANPAIASDSYLIPPDSCECPCNLIGYTDLQDARCLECLNSRPKLDSNLVDKEIQIAAQKAQLGEKDKLISDCTTYATNLQAKLERREKLKKWLNVAIGVLIGIAIIELIIILAK